MYMVPCGYHSWIVKHLPRTFPFIMSVWRQILLQQSKASLKAPYRILQATGLSSDSN